MSKKVEVSTDTIKPKIKVKFRGVATVGRNLKTATASFLQVIIGKNRQMIVAADGSLYAVNKLHKVNFWDPSTGNTHAKVLAKDINLTLASDGQGSNGIHAYTAKCTACNEVVLAESKLKNCILCASEIDPEEYEDVELELPETSEIEQASSCEDAPEIEADEDSEEEPDGDELEDDELELDDEDVEGAGDALEDEDFCKVPAADKGDKLDEDESDDVVVDDEEEPIEETASANKKKVVKASAKFKKVVVAAKAKTKKVVKAAEEEADPACEVEDEEPGDELGEDEEGEDFQVEDSGDELEGDDEDGSEDFELEGDELNDEQEDIEIGDALEDEGTEEPVEDEGTEGVEGDEIDEETELNEEGAEGEDTDGDFFVDDEGSVNIDLVDGSEVEDDDECGVEFAASTNGNKRWIASVNGLPVAFATEATAGANKDIFATPSFGKVVTQVIAKSGLKGLKALGFQSIVISAPVKGLIQAAVAAEVTASEVKVEKQLKALASDFNTCLGMASVGINRGFFNDVINPLKLRMWEELSAMKIPQPHRVIDRVFKETSEDYSRVLIEKASELYGKAPEVRAELSKAIIGTSFVAVAEDEEPVEEVGAEGEDASTEETFARHIEQSSLPVRNGGVVTAATSVALADDFSSKLDAAFKGL